MLLAKLAKILQVLMRISFFLTNGVESVWKQASKKYKNPNMVA
jgi:hypothetical protein